MSNAPQPKMQALLELEKQRLANGGTKPAGYDQALLDAEQEGVDAGRFIRKES